MRSLYYYFFVLCRKFFIWDCLRLFLFERAWEFFSSASRTLFVLDCLGRSGLSTFDITWLYFVENHLWIFITNFWVHNSLEVIQDFFSFGIITKSLGLIRTWLSKIIRLVIWTCTRSFRIGPEHWWPSKIVQSGNVWGRLRLFEIVWDFEEPFGTV